MNRMICRNGFVFAAALCLGLMVTCARGGGLDASAAPTNPASAMWTLNDIYKVLDTRTTNVTKRTGAFTEPGGGPTNGTIHTLNEIMTLVTNRAPVSKTGQTNSYTPYDDGWYGTNIGVAWPTQRFTAVAAVGAETNQIRDNLTGLIWARNANLVSNLTLGAWSSVNGTCTWAQAFDVITNSAGPVNGIGSSPYGYGGTNDWRLPNRRELLSVRDDGMNSSLGLPAGHPFTGAVNDYYWSSTTDANSLTFAWMVSLADHGASMAGDKSVIYAHYVWPVRGGQ